MRSEIRIETEVAKDGEHLTVRVSRSGDAIATIRLCQPGDSLEAATVRERLHELSEVLDDWVRKGGTLGTGK